MSQENENVKIVQAAFENFQKGEIDSLLTRLDESIVWETPFPPNIVPFGGKRSGKAQVREFFTTLGTLTDMLRFEPSEYLTSGDTVIVLGFYEGRVHQTQRTSGTDFVMIFRIRNGKITSFKEFADTHAVVQSWLPVAVAH